ncbi:MAG: transposase [Planctomycetota bacterium]|jgi:putative transposase
MPRAARIVLPNCPHHIVHRGHNRSVVFAEAPDFLFYLKTLSEWKAKLGLKIYAYCCMTNHVHLVVNPGDVPANLALLMKHLAGRYTQYVNRIEQRTGTVWEGRFKSSPVDTDEYLLRCCRYVELNPERAGIVTSPHQYQWSSYIEKIGRRQRFLVDEDQCYRDLGCTRREREVAYREWVMSSVPEGEWDLVRAAAQRGQPTGNQRFVDEVERRLGRRIELRGRGRPQIADN